MNANPDYESIARAHGWTEVDRDPSEDRCEDGPCLWHEGADYAAPLGAWRDACELLGILDADGNLIAEDA